MTHATPHDQLFKDLLRNFFDQLIELVIPELVPELDLGQISFLEQELFSDIPAGERSMADIVARIKTRSGASKLILLHGEIETTFRQATAERLWRYSLHLILKHRLPVVTLVLYLSGGPGGVRKETLVHTVGRVETHTFTYYAFGLANSLARAYLEKPQELAWSLAALMNPGRWKRPRHKLECWKRLVHAKVDPAKHFLLSNIVETYVKLDAQEQVVFDQYLDATQESEEIRTMQMTWAQEWELKGLERGRQEGMQKGMRMLLVQLLERRFGSLPSQLLQKIEQLEEPERLQEVGARVLDARSLDDLEL